MCYFEYLGRDAESLQRCFARTENVNSRTWGYKNTIVGTSRHPNKNYWYNLVWTDNSGNIITNFIIEEGINYRIDAYLNKSSRLYKNSVNSNDLKLVRSELEAGYVFNDNDERISSNRLELDTCTHYLETITNKFSKSGGFLSIF